MERVVTASTGLLRSTRGNVALLGALMMPVVLLAAGGAMDYARYTTAHDALQEIADAAALAGAREYVVVSDKKSIPTAVADYVAGSRIAATPGVVDASQTVIGVDADKTVTVDITFLMHTSLLTGVYKKLIDISVSATAQASGSANVCIIALEKSGPQSISMDTSATVTGSSCAVFANSTSTKSLVVVDNAGINSALTCTSGGYSGNGVNYDPEPITDCPPREDPLSARTAPVIDICNSAPSYYKDATVTLSPGHYCGGLMFEGNSYVTFSSGIYVISGKKLFIGDATVVQGENVGFYFFGDKAIAYIDAPTTISLTAPTTGPMAGLLMFQDRNASTKTQFQIASNNAKTLVGTIYLPKARLFIDAQQPVAEKSAYTAIIVRELQLSSSVNLVLNSNYHLTTVPVPAGLSGSGGAVTLRY